MQQTPAPQSSLPVSQAMDSDEDQIDLRAYLGIFNKYKWRIFILSVLITLLTYLHTLSLTPVYQATATLLLETESAKIVSIEEVYGVGAGQREYLATQLGILNSRSIAEKVVERLDLPNHPMLDPQRQKKSQSSLELNWREWLPADWLPPAEPPQPPSPSARKQAAINEVRAGLSINHVRNSRLVKISFDSPLPELAASVPNTLVDVYIKSDLEARLQMTKDAASWLTERLENLRIQLEKSEKKLQQYLESADLVDVGVKSMAGDQLTTLTQGLLQAKTQLSQLNSVYAQVRAMKGQPASAYEVIPRVLNDPLVQSLKQAELEAERKVTELSKRYGPKYPKMIAAQSDLQKARATTGAQIMQVVAGIEKEYQAARAHVNALEEARSSSEDKVQDITRKEYRLQVLKREVETNRQLYDMFLTRFKETDVSQTQQSTIGRIVDAAQIPGGAYKPRKNRIVAMALALSLLASTLLAFLLEYLDNTLKTPDDVEGKLDVACLGSLPLMKSARDKKQMQFLMLQDSQSGFSEAIRTIRTGILLSGLDSPHKVLLVTSSLPDEGKTVFSVNQAFALGQVKKTLLIDADMRRPSIGDLFGFQHKTSGLSELVAGTRNLSECIHPIEGTGVDVVVSGIIPPNPLELLSSERFKKTLAALEERYEQLVIDTGPLGSVSDALALSKYANAMVFVVKADSTPYPVVGKAVKQLLQARAPLLGVVLNQVNYSKKGYYYGYNPYGYNGKKEAGIE